MTMFYDYGWVVEWSLQHIFMTYDYDFYFAESLLSTE